MFYFHDESRSCKSQYILASKHALTCLFRCFSIFWIKITLHCDEVKKKMNTWVSFVDWRSFKTNKIVILFCRELISRSKNLNQGKSRSLLKAKKHFNVEIRIYYFCQFIILTLFLSFRYGYF